MCLSSGNQLEPFMHGYHDGHRYVICGVARERLLFMGAVALTPSHPWFGFSADQIKEISGFDITETRRGIQCDNCRGIYPDEETQWLIRVNGLTERFINTRWPNGIGNLDFEQHYNQFSTDMQFFCRQLCMRAKEAALRAAEAQAVLDGLELAEIARRVGGTPGSLQRRAYYQYVETARMSSGDRHPPFQTLATNSSRRQMAAPGYDARIDDNFMAAVLAKYGGVMTPSEDLIMEGTTAETDQPRRSIILPQRS